jgi:Fe-S-cluster containining protein
VSSISTEESSMPDNEDRGQVTMGVEAPLSAADPIERRLAQGLHFADMMGATNQQALLENQVLLHALTELLVSKGAIRLHELEERKKAVAEYFDERGRKPKVHLVVTDDKYEERHRMPVDCETRIHLCKGRCCKLWFALSVQDIEERIVRWNYAEPYAIARGEDGRCVHQERGGSYRCGVWENRPLICRTYTCRDDKRIWLDFDQRIINPDLEREDWPSTSAAE